MALSRASMAFVGAVLAGLLALIVMSELSSPSSPPRTAGAQPTPPPTAGAQPGPPPTAGAQPAAPAPFPTDDRGFINSAARCDGAQTAVAAGRTNRSLIVICTDPSGSYQYRGVRIGDGAALTAPATTTGDGQFVARADNITYAVSPKELLVKSDDSVLRQEPMLAYQQPRFSAQATPSGHAPG
jgi:hypothetical protein